MMFLAAALGDPFNALLWLCVIAVGVYIIYYAVGQTGIPAPMNLPVKLLLLLLIVVGVLKVIGFW